MEKLILSFNKKKNLKKFNNKKLKIVITKVITILSLIFLIDYYK